MEKREQALETFLLKRKSKKEVIGAIVCGSFVTGNSSSHSDIDLHLILDKKTTQRERGNEIIDGILIEYFANPVATHQHYLQEDFQDRRKVNAHMLVTGKVLFDNTGELKKLVQDAKKYLTKKYPKLTKTQVEIAKYHLRDMQDNLLEVLENDAEGFPLVYYVSLYELFDSYAKFLQFDALPIHKLKHLLMDASTKKKYMIADFPDQVFVHLFLPALSLREKADMSEAYTQLSDHVLVKMCGFEIDGRKIRTPAVEKK